MTPVVVSRPSAFVNIPVPASSTPTRIGTNLKTTLITRLTDSNTKAESASCAGGGTVSSMK